VVWQTAIQPVAAIELPGYRHLAGVGVLGPEAFQAQPFLDLLAEYGSPTGIDECRGRLTVATSFPGRP